MKANWISVEDDVPDIGVPVYGFCKGGVSYVVCFRSVIDWYVSETERGIGDLITHWMPLPDPPEDDR